MIEKNEKRENGVCFPLIPLDNFELGFLDDLLMP